MVKKRIVVLFGMALIYINSSAQVLISGTVLEKESKSSTIPLAVVRVLSTNQIAIADTSGKFSVEVIAEWPQQLIISSVGFSSDTLTIKDSNVLRVFLKKSIQLKEVEIIGKKESLGISTIQTINTEKITEVELLKAACCNLSEAFETNPVISVAYKDAVTGAKEIQLLGLSGIYSQLLTENIPNMQGIAGIFGLTFIPGPWMESIQLTKGSGSVLNGYESTTGLINVEFKKPLEKTTPRFYLNVFEDEHQSTEVNSFYKLKVKENVSTMLLVHGRYMHQTEDNNLDGFSDIPANKQINLYNRWQIDLNKRLEMQIGLKYLIDQTDGGEINHTIDDLHNRQLYKTKVETKRAELYSKFGIVYPSRRQMSIGNIFQMTYHDMNSYFGLKKYDAREKTLSYQGIFQNYLFLLNHEYKIGVSYRYNEVNQSYNSIPSLLVENIPGVFLEYTYSHKDKFKLIAGVRDDYHFEDGWIVIPRLHVKYNFSENSIIRASAGSSYRRPYIYADHISTLATSRDLIVDEKINAERALNYGLNFTQKVVYRSRAMSLNIDLYRTEFSEQLIADMYSDRSSIHFYNLKGKSFSNSFQITYNIEIRKGFDLRLAYKMDDVKTTYNGQLSEVPLVTKERALMNMAYDFKRRHLKFDYTVVWEGRRRLQNIPNENGVVTKYSPNFFVMNIQITKEFKKISFYGGAENFLNFRQLDPIISASEPFSSNFDATNVWGPISGRRIYLGLRFSIK